QAGRRAAEAPEAAFRPARSHHKDGHPAASARGLSVGRGTAAADPGCSLLAAVNDAAARLWKLPRSAQKRQTNACNLTERLGIYPRLGQEWQLSENYKKAQWTNSLGFSCCTGDWLTPGGRYRGRSWKSSSNARPPALNESFASCGIMRVLRSNTTARPTAITTPGTAKPLSTCPDCGSALPSCWRWSPCSNCWQGSGRACWTAPCGRFGSAWNSCCRPNRWESPSCRAGCGCCRLPVARPRPKFSAPSPPPPCSGGAWPCATTPAATMA